MGVHVHVHTRVQIHAYTYTNMERAQETYFFLLSFSLTLLSPIPGDFCLPTSRNGCLSFSLPFTSPKTSQELSFTTFSSTPTSIFSTINLSTFSLSLVLVAILFSSLQNSVIWLIISRPANKFLAERVLFSLGGSLFWDMSSAIFVFSVLDLIAAFMDFAWRIGGVDKFGFWFSVSSLNLELLFEETDDWVSPLLFNFASLN